MERQKYISFELQPPGGGVFKHVRFHQCLGRGKPAYARFAKGIAPLRIRTRIY
jgi:hypothetical protein